VRNDSRGETSHVGSKSLVFGKGRACARTPASRKKKGVRRSNEKGKKVRSALLAGRRALRKDYCPCGRKGTRERVVSMGGICERSLGCKRVWDFVKEGNSVRLGGGGRKLTHKCQESN